MSCEVKKLPAARVNINRGCCGRETGVSTKTSTCRHAVSTVAGRRCCQNSQELLGAALETVTALFHHAQSCSTTEPEACILDRETGKRARYASARHCTRLGGPLSSSSAKYAWDDLADQKGNEFFKLPNISRIMGGRWVLFDMFRV